ncbi:hypothetical protein K443DRAFT_420798 [Laccaria amethystina LaAM-08-1]|uniref:Uncharacterized protein n=1 Tax=Laccaria amethystina LaAM-08-1 TaxID=1095629 RepID=A0A0C9WPF5_9AGAR|nr:hypothetical protein K443DRAFT_420798 [Laccaria amethystina LaAM-08-1]
MLSFNFKLNQGRTHTKPIMQLPNPRRPRILYRQVQKYNLVLYPDLMHDRLQHHMSLHELPTNHQSLLTTQQKKMKPTFSFIRLSPLLLLATSLTGSKSLRTPPSSTLSNSAHHT